MGKKRKALPSGMTSQKLQDLQHSINETFDESEDEFHAQRDNILLDEAPAAKRRRKIEQETADLQPSDEEVYADDPEDDDEDAERTSDEDVDVEEEEGEDERVWGTSRRDYYNADIIETEADAIDEETEAHRLQQKHLKDMTVQDFVFDEFQWSADTKYEGSKRPIVEKLPQIRISDDASQEDRLKILRTRYPEFQPLAEDLITLNPLLQDLRTNAANRRSSSEPSVEVTKTRALSAYLASITLYLAILTSTKDGLAMAPADLREHPIMTSLLRCRQLWDAVKNLETEVDSEVDETSSEEVEADPALLSAKAKTTKIAKEKTASRRGNFEKDVTSTKSILQSVIVPDHEESSQSFAKKKSKTKSKRQDLRDIISQSTGAIQAEEESDFGDETPLTHEEAVEKARKKKSLRFYTSQIAQKANRRGAASRDAGGDDDVPYKERNKDRQVRIAQEAERRQNQPSMDDGGDDDVEADLVQQINGDGFEYYNEIVSKSHQKKVDKLAKAAAFSEAARLGRPVHVEEVVGPDGKRKITYAIEKNKGLTPKRKKEVRNPRVKKKLRYEQKMKKLSSIRPVYKGGEAKGGYGGELAGIKTNVIKSVKL